MSKYLDFISSILEARPENRRFKYSECHHIKPKCLGGTWDDGYIYLTYREHYTAHVLLVDEYPDNIKLREALFLMSGDKKYECTPEEYEYARRGYIDKVSVNMIGEGNPFYGHQHTEETRRHLSEVASTKVGALNNHYGMQQTEKNKLAVASSNSRRKGFKKITNGIINKQIREEELEMYVSSGWRLGTIFNCTCIICNSNFTGSSPTSSYCPDCYKYSRRGRRNANKS